ncbi:YheC/YheD family protein [Neobacillus niacini]|uniref:YheC/YheD family endospore coat-associated protein n=1 Tax=Neobacillus niacini TaxID=86668 RepID=UPI0028559C5A|nr:YheC/YheD family protein [Neobacillus niacini]MDR7001289.1 glutathione synthase/RimK-type ligase-like ATP-grasp enzyme [Neobacillus niacini]
MKIYYDMVAAQWYQSEIEGIYTFGGEKKPISYNQADTDHLSFELGIKNNHLGPLIGIMTARKRNGAVTGNGPLFIELQKKLISHGGISFIFTSEGVYHDSIEGYTFLPSQEKWIKITAPYPNLVYNRIPFRKSEQAERSQRFFQILKDRKIPFFNPCFIDKYELYYLFKNHPILQKYLPKTILAAHKEDLFSFLQKHGTIYLKPAQSAKGKGIYRLKQIENNKICLQGLNKNENFPTFHSFWEHWEKELTMKNYLAQEEIDSAQFEGNRFDFRILVHAEQNDYQVTGIGIRQSYHQDLTTHVPLGGRLLPYGLLQTNEHDDFIQTIVKHAGRVLSDELGFFGEFSIDACVSHSGNYYLYEVNSKPMSFDETEIEDKKINQLCSLFYQIANF